MNAPFEPPGTARADVEAVLGAAARLARSRARRRRTLLAAFAVAALAGGGAWWTLGRGDAPTVYTTGTAGRGDLVVTVTATGSLYPTNEVEVSSEQSGTVKAVHVDYNSPVRKGDVIAELDPDKLEMAVKSAEARLASARAGVADAEATIAETRADLDRKTVLAGTKAASRADLDTAEAAYRRAAAGRDIAQAAVAVAEADLSQAETNLSKAAIRSPIDGVVLTRAVEPGQTVAASLSAPVLFTLAEDLTRMELRVDVDEADVGRVAVGQSGSFAVDAYPERTFPARIRVVRYASETVQNVVTYKATLDVDNADLSLRPGMTATAEIVVERVHDALLVPNAALRWAPPAAPAAGGGNILMRLLPRPPPRQEAAAVPADAGRAVYVLRAGVPVRVAVDPGATDGRNTVVTGDLEAGDAVIVDAATAQ